MTLNAASLPRTISAILRTHGLINSSPTVWGFYDLAIWYATSQEACRNGFCGGENPYMGNVPARSNLVLLSHKVSMSFPASLLPCLFLKCSLSFDGFIFAFENMVLHRTHCSRCVPSFSVAQLKPY